MKKKTFFILLAVIAVFALTLSSCGKPETGPAVDTQKSESAKTEKNQDDQDDEDEISDDATPEDLADYDTGEDLPEEWTAVGSVDEALQAVGLDAFKVPEGAQISLGTLSPVEYSYQDDTVRARVSFPASEIRIYKENENDPEDLDDYDEIWEQEIGGVKVKCGGNVKEHAMETTWVLGGKTYSIRAIGLGGDPNFGLSADDLETLVKGIK